jgi:hypothetical protein
VSAPRGRPHSWREAACAAGGFGGLVLLLGLGACRGVGEPEPGGIGVAEVREESVLPGSTVVVHLRRAQAGHFFATPCEARLERHYPGEGWVATPPQPTACESDWVAFGPGRDASVKVLLPAGMTDGPHRVSLMVLSYDPTGGGAGALTRLGLDESRLISNRFDVIAIR